MELSGKEETMSDVAVKPQGRVYSFLGESPGEKLLDVARIHHREAKQLFEGAETAKAEGREEEAKLLYDLAVAREATATEFEKAAKGEVGDPIVAEILDWQEDINKNYSPFTSDYVPPEDDAPAEPPAPEPFSLSKSFLRGVAWVGSWFA
jgi:hypothetical protein